MPIYQYMETGKAPYYGPETNVYGDDVKLRCESCGLVRHEPVGTRVMGTHCGVCGQFSVFYPERAHGAGTAGDR